MIERWRVESGDMSSLHAIRSAAVAMLQADGDVRADYDACALAVSELISNAMRHGPAGTIDVTLEWGGVRPTLAVRDGGRGFPLRIALPDGRSEGGRGLYLVAKLVGVPEVACDDDGCTVSVVLPVRRRNGR